MCVWITVLERSQRLLIHLMFHNAQFLRNWKCKSSSLDICKREILFCFSSFTLCNEPVLQFYIMTWRWDFWLSKRFSYSINGHCLEYWNNNLGWRILFIFSSPLIVFARFNHDAIQKLNFGTIFGLVRRLEDAIFDCYNIGLIIVITLIS